MTYNDALGFKIGDRVRLKDGDGREHTIKGFELVRGIRSDFYRVHFDDNAATGFLAEGYTDMVKIGSEG